MIQTVRCARCGQAIDAYIEFAAGLPQGLSRQAIQTKVQSAQIRHADKCPSRQLLTSPPTRREPASPLTSARHARVLAPLLRRARRRLRRVVL